MERRGNVTGTKRGWATARGLNLLEMSRNEGQAWGHSRGSQSCCSSRGVGQRTQVSQCGGRQGDEWEDDEVNCGLKSKE